MQRRNLAGGFSKEAGEHSDERAAPRGLAHTARRPWAGMCGLRTSGTVEARSRRHPARLIAAGGRQGGTEWVGVRLRELGARRAAIHASEPPMVMQAGAEPHFAL